MVTCHETHREASNAKAIQHQQVTRAHRKHQASSDLSSHGSPGLLKLQKPLQVLLTSLFLLDQPEFLLLTKNCLTSRGWGRRGAMCDSDLKQAPRDIPTLLVNTKKSLNSSQAHRLNSSCVVLHHTGHSLVFSPRPTGSTASCCCSCLAVSGPERHSTVEHINKNTLEWHCLRST